MLDGAQNVIENAIEGTLLVNRQGKSLQHFKSPIAVQTTKSKSVRIILVTEMSAAKRPPVARFTLYCITNGRKQSNLSIKNTNIEVNEFQQAPVARENLADKKSTGHKKKCLSFNPVIRLYENFGTECQLTAQQDLKPLLDIEKR